ncbi:hypothetical protein GCM10025734_36030 [Kitasatospora paranensis]
MTNEWDLAGTLPAQAAAESEPAGYGDLLRDVKAEITSAHVRVHRVVNTELITHYWRIGRIILERPTRDFYARQAVQHGWSRNVPVHRIETGLHLRQGTALHNFDATVPDGSELLRDLVRDPYLLDFTRLGDGHSEQDLESALVAHVVRFLQELGVGFAFVGRQTRSRSARRSSGATCSSTVCGCTGTWSWS